ncbi:MAG: hypothetical protein PHO42_01440 [Candidatus Omnitrophica bacterium]|nr:hypothetical protein [Candidatus Omnitrophota bacterium]
MSKLLSELKQLEQFQEELAKTYFSNSPSRDNPPVSASPMSKIKKINPPSLATIIVILLAAMIVGFFLFNRVAVEIKIIPASAQKTLNETRQAGDVVYLNKDGELNTDLIRNIVFYENAHNDSGLGKESIVLSNEIPSKKAILGIDFNKPLNLKKYLFCFYSKGAESGEQMRVSLRDSRNDVCNSSVNELGDSWKQFIIDAQDAGDLIDPEKVTHVDVEVNPDERPDSERSTIFIKEIFLAKRRE